MKKKNMLKRYATFVEYALLVGLMAIGVAVGITVFGDKIMTFFQGAGDKIETVGDEASNADIALPSDGQ